MEALRWQRLVSEPPAAAVDAALAVAAVVFFVLVTPLQVTHTPGARPLGVDGYALLVAAGAVLALRRRLPLLAYATSLASAVVYLLQGHPWGPILVAPFAALLTVAAVTPLRAWIVAAVLGTTALAVVHGLTAGISLTTAAYASAWLAIAGLFGATVEVRRRYQAEARASAQWAERSREEEGRRRLAEDRLRIAREVHDVVGHSLAVISLQAGVAGHLLASRPEEAERAVRSIRQVSRQALNDLRVELASLRGEGDAGAAGRPAPRLAALPDLVASVRQSGLRAELVLSGDQDAVPEVVATAGYRIVQESLTNVARHAGPDAAARISVSARPESLELEVTDDGRGPGGGTSAGRGISGMRDRAAALGGELQAGARPEGGFRVWARLPTNGAG